MNSRAPLLLGMMLQALQQRCRARREFASAGNRIKRGEAPKIETFVSEVARKEDRGGGVRVALAVKEGRWGKQRGENNGGESLDEERQSRFESALRTSFRNFVMEELVTASRFIRRD